MNRASPPASLHGCSQEEWQIRCGLAAFGTYFARDAASRLIENNKSDDRS